MWPVQGSSPQAGGFSDVSRLLASLNLSHFEDQLKALGVESVADLKYVTEADLREMKMTVIQCRKFVELCSGVLATCVGSVGNTLAIADAPAKVAETRPRSRSREPPGSQPAQKSETEDASSHNNKPAWKDKGENGSHKSSWKDKHHNNGHKSSWKDGHDKSDKHSWKDGHDKDKDKPSWKDAKDDQGWKNAPWDGVWKEPGWKADEGSSNAPKWKDGGENGGGNEKSKWGSWKDDKHWKKSKSSWKDNATEPESPSKQEVPAKSPNIVLELAPKASSAESQPKQPSTWGTPQGAASKGGGLLMPKAGSPKAAVHVVHAPGRSSGIAALPPQALQSLPQGPPAPALQALDGLMNDDIFKAAEVLLKQNGIRKYYWEDVAKLKATFNFGERIELGLKLLEPEKLNALLKENGDLNKLLTESANKDETLRGLIRKHDPNVDQMVTQLEQKDLEINGPLR